MRPIQSCHRDLIPYTTLTRWCLAVLPWAAGVDHGPIPRGVLEAALARHVVFRNLGVLRVSWLRRAEEGLEGDESGLESEDWGPGVLEDVEADGARRGGDVRVVDLRDELHLYGLEGVVVWDDDVLVCDVGHSEWTGDLDLCGVDLRLQIDRPRMGCPPVRRRPR